MPCLLCCSIFLAAIFIPAGGFVPVHPTIYHTKQWQYGGSTSIKRKLSRAETSILMAQTSSSCPFSKAFPRYKIDLTRMSTAKKKDRFSLPFVSDIQKSSSCSKLQQKFNNIPLRWMEKDEAPIDIYFALWSLAADVSDSSNREVTAVLAMPDNSHLQLAQYWVDILNWMQDQDILQNCAGNEKLEATIYQEGDAVAVKLKRTGDIQSSAARQTNNDEIENDATILNKRTQSWVKRILVDQGICPFTKSVKVSGQGLGDLGIPVARIHYCSSNARLDQISKLMTGKTSAGVIFFMRTLAADRYTFAINNSSNLVKIPGKKSCTCCKWVQAEN